MTKKYQVTQDELRDRLRESVKSRAAWHAVRLPAKRGPQQANGCLTRRFTFSGSASSTWNGCPQESPGFPVRTPVVTIGLELVRVKNRVPRDGTRGVVKIERLV